MIKWGSTVVTAVKWGNTNCTAVYWGNTKVFPDDVVIYSGGNATNTFSAYNQVVTDYTTETYQDYWWEAWGAVGFTQAGTAYNFSNSNPVNSGGVAFAQYTLTNGLSAYSKHKYTSSGEDRYTRTGITKFCYKSSKVDLTNKTTVTVTVNNWTNKVPIYVGGTETNTNNVIFKWCIRADTNGASPQTVSVTIPSANRNANCYLNIMVTIATSLGQDNEGTNVINNIKYS